MDTTRRLLTYAQAARFLNVPIGTLYAWVHQRRIPHHRLGPRTIRFTEADLVAFVEATRVDAIRVTAESRR